ncbi:MAG TPA: GatB/YqeY domain-containing protein [Candidatus Saccharimonadia bacterium]|jgi:hypothetical protein|nr:GatB/YqeY domain-containing protein [Candidatus Saccharimonadia bacterium]
MKISEQLTEDMKTSMREGNSERTGVLRLLRGALKNEQIKVGHELDDAEELKVLQREAKQRRDSIEAYQSAGRAELVATEQGELDIITTYLPEAMSEDELKKVVDQVVTEMGADMSKMGQVIGAVMKQVGAKAEGGTVSRLVRERLAA